MSGLVDTFEGGIPNDKFLGQGNPVLGKLLLQRTIDVEDTQHAAPNLKSGRAMQMGVVPVHAGGMVQRDVEAIAITLAGIHHNVGCVRIMRADGVEHVNGNIESVEVQVGRIKALGNVVDVQLHERGIRDGLFVELILDIFSWLLQHLPVILGLRFVRSERIVHLVVQLDPERLPRPDAHGGTHERVRPFL
eukprot:scaffold68940_cov52-Attheya_sp.AAC.2